MQKLISQYKTIAEKGISRLFYFVITSLMLFSVFISVGFTDELSIVSEVEFQPLASATQRLIEALDYLGSPLSEDDLTAIKKVLVSEDQKQAVVDIQNILDAYCLAGININPESRVKVKEGSANKELMQQGWRTFLVKVHNEAGVTAPLAAESKMPRRFTSVPLEVLNHRQLSPKATFQIVFLKLVFSLNHR